MPDLLNDVLGDTPAAPTPVTLRAFNDIPAQRKAIYDQALTGVKARFPIESPTHRLELSDAGYDGDFTPTKADEKRALLSGGRLHRPLSGTVRLVDKANGQTLDEKRTILAHVPHLTNDGLYIHNGTRWGIRNQQRLRSGIYVRRQKSGGVEAHVNVEPGSGRGFRVNLDPSSGQFKLQVDQSTTKLYPLLKALGIPDDRLKQAWGDELFTKNWRESSGHDVSDLRKTVQKLGRKADQAAPDHELAQTLHGILNRSKVDPEVNEVTLGKRHEAPNHDALVAATQKILDVANDRHPGDNRDSQSFQSTHSAEDFIQERLAKDPSGAARKLLWAAQKTGKLDKLHAGLLTPNIHGLYRSGLAQAVEDVNPLETYDQRQSVTRMGEGGIGSERAVSRDARGVQPSYLGAIDSVRTPESSKIGLDLRVTDAALKGSDGQIYIPLQNARHGGTAPVSTRTMAKSVVAFPGEMSKPGNKVRVMVNDQIRYVNRGAVDYALPDATNMFSRTSNLVPLHEGAKSGRLLMGSRMLTQALPLKDAEAPLVHSVDADGQSFYEKMGKDLGALHAEKPGTVTHVSPDAIHVRHPDGTTTQHDLYNHYPRSRKTMLHNTPVVQPGQSVQPGQLLAHSNFTDKNGVAAPGTNLRVGYLSGHGATYEDAMVISESAAKRLTSEHHHKYDLDLGPHVHSTDTAKYRAVYGDKFTPAQYQNLDEGGVIKPGTTVNPGDPLMVGIGKKEGRAVGALMKSGKTAHTDISQIWDHAQPGIVTDVTKTKSGIKVAVKSHAPMVTGDKLSNLFGGKGVISRILPDARMPHDADGKPLELLQSPFGIISRGNPTALVNTLLGKIAQKRGEAYKLKSFSTPGGLADFALSEAAKHGVSETEELTDPTTGRKLPNVFTGQQYMLKLHHTAEGKISARDTAGYAADESPAGGGPEGSKRIGLLDVSSLLSSGATEFLKDAKLIRGQRNDDYWRALKAGETPIAPTKNFANEHFQNMLKAAGVHLKQTHDGKQQLGFMTDADVDHMAQHEITNSGTYDFKTMKPVKDGLFDLGKTGGADGMRWSKTTLPAKIPNPLAEPAITRILGVTGKQFERILGGQEELDGKTGPEAIEHALKGVDVDKALEATKNDVRGGSGSARDAAIKKMGFLAGLKKQGLKPEDLLISKLPILPPKYRPVTRARGLDVIHDANYLYHDLMEASKNYTESKSTFGEAGSQYLTMYKAAKAVAGMHDPVNEKYAEQGVRGMLRSAIGVKDSPKYSRFQRKVLGNSVDTVGRSVITIDPELNMDQIGMPEEMAWTQFRPFVIRSLVRSGMPAAQAVKAVRDRSSTAEKHLLTEMEHRPVVYNRAPSLHRYNYVGGMAKINKGTDNISIPQSSTKGLGADFDGDCGRILILAKTRISSRLWVNHEGTHVMPINSPIASYQGPVAIQDLPVILESKVTIRPGCYEFDVVAGTEMYALDTKTGEHRWYPVTKMSVHEDLDMRIVSVGNRSGETLTVSADHSLIAYKDGAVIPVTPDESVGAMIPVAKRLAGDPQITALSATGESKRGWSGVVASHQHEVQLNQATGLFLGLLIGDGWVDTDDKVHIAACEPSVRSAWEQSAKGLPFGEHFLRKWKAVSLGNVETERARVSLHCSWFGRWLRSHVGEGALNKKIPSFCFGASEEHLLGLLDGLMCTDGTVNIVKAAKKAKSQFQVSYATSSPDLVDGFRYLCRVLGMSTSCTPYTSKESGKAAYMITVATPDFLSLVKRTGFTCSHTGKQAIIMAGLPLINLDSTTVASTDLVPYPSHLHQVLSNAGRQLVKSGTPDQNQATCSRAKLIGNWSRQLAKRWCDTLRGLNGLQLQQLCVNRGNHKLTVPVAVLEGLPAYLSLVDDTDITWKPIVDVQVAPRQTGFDVTIPGPLTFATASGIIVQDTINVHVPVSEAAADEVKQKLFPSKNLIHPNSFDVHLEPSQEFLAGLYLASEQKHKEPKVFKTRKDAEDAERRGEIGVSDPIQILHE
jgi:DNA-directed RNA polymerase beta subunit